MSRKRALADMTTLEAVSVAGERKGAASKSSPKKSISKKRS